MALSYDDPFALPYPGAVPASGYPLPVSSFEGDQEDLFRQAMAPQPIMPSEPVPYPEPEPVPSGQSLVLPGELAKGTAGGEGTARPAPVQRFGFGGAGTATAAPEIAAPAPDENPYVHNASAAQASIADAQPYDLAAPAAPTPAPSIETAAPVNAAPFEVDALSGGYTPEQANRIVGNTDVRGLDITDEQRPGETDSEYDDRVRRMSPANYFRWKEKQDAKYRQEAERQNTELTRKIQDDSDREAQAQQDAKAETRAARDRNAQAAQALAATKIDPDHWWHSRSTGQKIAGVLAAVAGGLLEARGTGRNTAVPMLMKFMDDDAEAQRLNLERQRQGLEGEARSIEQKARDDDEDRQVLQQRRLAGYQVLRDQIATSMQNFNPNGARAQRFRDAMQAVDAAALKQQDEDDKVNYGRKLELARLGIDVDKQNLEREKFLHQQKLDAAKAAGVGKTAKPVAFADQPQGPDELRKLGIEVPEGFTGTMSIKDAKSLADAGASGAEWKKKAEEVSPAAVARNFGVGEIVDEDGKIVRFSEDSRKRMAPVVASASNILRNLDELIALREQKGGSSELMNSPEWQEAMVKYTSVILDKKTADALGALAGGDLDLEKGSLGTKDPTQWRDPLPGLREARRQVKEKVNSAARIEASADAEGRLPNGRLMRSWDPPRISGKKSESLIKGETTAEKGQNARLGPAGEFLSYSITNDERTSQAENASKAGPTGLDPSDDKAVVNMINVAGGGVKGKTAKDASQAIDTLAAAMTGRESVGNAMAARIRGVNPDVYQKVLAKLPEDTRARFKETEVSPEAAAAASFGTPAFKLDNGAVSDLAGQLATDKAFQTYVIKTAGGPAGKTRDKAIQILQAATTSKAAP